ncbi:CLAVATA3/ESR (CLE)-RELATED PROTEIN 41-RELATED [Salix purpurea]|uniref:CLAVATA3/ESR (CLE)-RELATED PROTEIN 41-RELATED n=1 Tax=Salix purpurea TaxID=77065 RepID=A0A9Q0TJL4_SALPP|nr:CLAVATA3/ESR (CLE)-RELATED PROTEIN 41-RELATED [Salix purpurea]
MAGDVGSRYLTSLTILFFLLIMSQATMAIREHRSLLGTSRDGEYIKKNDMEFFPARRHEMGNANTVSEANVIRNIPPQSSRRRGRFRAHRSPLPWQEGIFNASAHEVPSGPNPISNR